MFVAAGSNASPDVSNVVDPNANSPLPLVGPADAVGVEDDGHVPAASVSVMLLSWLLRFRSEGQHH